MQMMSLMSQMSVTKIVTNEEVNEIIGMLESGQKDIPLAMR